MYQGGLQTITIPNGDSNSVINVVFGIVEQAIENSSELQLLTDILDTFSYYDNLLMVLEIDKISTTQWGPEVVFGQSGIYIGLQNPNDPSAHSLYTAHSANLLHASDGTTILFKVVPYTQGNPAYIEVLGSFPSLENVLNTVAFTGAYSDLTGQPAIPTKTSDLQNDSGFITDVSDKMNKADGRGTGALIISGNNENAAVWASKVSGKNAYCGVRDNSTGYSQIYMGSYSDGKRAMYTTNSTGTSAALFTIDNNNKVTEGLLKRRYSLYAGDAFTTRTFNTLCFTLTGGQKELYTFIPMPLLEKLPSLTGLTIGLVLRHADGGYPFIRDGSTYTAVGDSYVYVINNGTKMGGVSTVALSNLSESGFTLRISLTNQLCKTSGSTTAVTNNVPLAGMVTIAGTIST